MEINTKELHELLHGEVYGARLTHEYDDNGDYQEYLELDFGKDETATLQWETGQIFYIDDANADDMFEGFTITVNEILDIVL